MVVTDVTLPFVGRAPVPEHRRRADRDLAGRADERRQLLRRGRRARRRAVHDRRDRVRGDRVRPRRRTPPACSRRSPRARRSASCSTTSTRRRSSWATPGPTCSATCSGWQRCIGSLKTNVVVALVVPLFILAVPFLDTGFVVAKRLKYRRKPWARRRQPLPPPDGADRLQPAQDGRYLYAWTLMLAGVASRCGSCRTPTTTAAPPRLVSVMGAIALVASPRASISSTCSRSSSSSAAREMRSVDPDTTEHEIDEAVATSRRGVRPRGIIARAEGEPEDLRRSRRSTGRDSRARGPGVDAGAPSEPRRGERAAGRRDG